MAQAYAMEILEPEAQWSHVLIQCAGIKTWFVNGAEDPATDVATIAEKREAFPWVDIEVIPNAGQLLMYQHFQTLIPSFAKAAKAVGWSGSCFGTCPISGRRANLCRISSGSLRMQ